MIDFNRLAKVWNLTTSPNAGEAAAARERARVMVARIGKTLADVPGLLRARQPQPERRPEPGGFAFYDMDNPAHAAAYEARERTRRAERARKEAPERAEAIRRHGGSVEAVLAWTAREAVLRQAVEAWRTPCDPPHERWTESIDGYSMHDLDPVPDRVRHALSRAYPLPATLADAAAEHADWQRRDRDLGLVLEDTTDTQLDLPAYLRWRIVEELLETGLRARSVAEVLIRQRHMIDQQCSRPEIEQAVLADLEALVAAGAGQGRPAAIEPLPSDTAPDGGASKLDTASKRRAEVARLLSNMDTAALPDREIARRVGVSPQTVGNIRRKGLRAA